MKQYFYIFLVISCNLFCQNDKLRVEIIDVFKEYVPQISNSQKISVEPIFLDTLNSRIISDKTIFNKKLNFKESIKYVSPDKYRFSNYHENFNKYIFMSIGNNSWLSTKMHYTNGVSVIHNSGIYLEHHSKKI